MAAPIAYIYSVKRGYNDKPATYEELAAIWTPRENGTAWSGEGNLNYNPFQSKIVLSKVKLARDGTPIQQGNSNKAPNGYGRSGGPQAAKAPARNQDAEDSDSDSGAPLF